MNRLADTGDEALGDGESSHTRGESSHERAPKAFSLPPVVVFPASELFGSTERRSSVFRPYRDASGNLARSRAATPETCGVAIDVPLNDS